MVHLVVKHPEPKSFLVADEERLEPCVRGDCGQSIELQMKRDVQRVRRESEVDKSRSEMDHMLDQVHQNAGSEADISVPMVDRMGQPTKGWPMQPAVDPIEIKTFPDRYQEKNGKLQTSGPIVLRTCRG